MLETRRLDRCSEFCSYTHIGTSISSFFTFFERFLSPYLFHWMRNERKCKRRKLTNFKRFKVTGVIAWKKSRDKKISKSTCWNVRSKIEKEEVKSRKLNIAFSSILALIFLYFRQRDNCFAPFYKNIINIYDIFISDRIYLNHTFLH